MDYFNTRRNFISSLGKVSAAIVIAGVMPSLLGCKKEELFFDDRQFQKADRSNINSINSRINKNQYIFAVAKNRKDLNNDIFTVQDRLKHGVDIDYVIRTNFNPWEISINNATPRLKYKNNRIIEVSFIDSNGFFLPYKLEKITSKSRIFPLETPSNIFISSKSSIVNLIGNKNNLFNELRTI